MNLSKIQEIVEDGGAWHAAVMGSKRIGDNNNKAKSLQLCWILCDPMNCRLPGSSIYGVSQARKVEWVAIHSSRGSS